MKATHFAFTSYQYEPQHYRITFHYQQHFLDQDPIDFTEIIELPREGSGRTLHPKLLEKLLQSLHLVIGISYYKFYCATELVHPYQFSKGEATFWDTIYGEGLGEFYFRNNLNPRTVPRFSVTSSTPGESFSLEKTGRFIVALSGGKDSIVAAHVLKEQGIDITAFFAEANRTTELVDHVAIALDISLVKIKRKLPLEKLKGHPYNGHIPISAIYAFLGIFYGALYGFDAFVVANEFSSNFGNIMYRGREVNHQWSKSFRFETLFADYLKKYISPDLTYFSVLRPLYEIRIAKLFARHKKYFPIFSSCNKNFTLVKGDASGRWCLECPKCVFSWILLSAFLSKKEMLGIFGANMYQKESLLPLFTDILGLGSMKPFDCVGTFQESRVAFLLGAKKFATDSIVKKLRSKIKVTKQETEDIFKAQPLSLIPEHLRFLGMDRVVILGYGKEGKATKEYLHRHFPKLNILVADQKKSNGYLKIQDKGDIAVKTPGMKKSLVTIPYTTATNIFFSEMQQRGIMTIGVTGSKGKSTVASLIFDMLKAGGKDARLVGNIGNPMLDELLKPFTPSTIFVVELSSYQLEDIAYSPHISVVTNLFPEHMDYHGSLKAYYEAKKNIVLNQYADDFFVYNQENAILRSWAKGGQAKSIPLADEGILKNVVSPLMGKHNQENIRLATSAARLLGVDDKIIQQAIEQFKPLPHRLAFVGEFQGIQFYDDAISTTPESTIAGIKSLKRVDTIFLGGEDRGYDFSQLEKTIKQFNIRNVVLFPNSGNRIQVKQVNILKTKSMDEAVRFAYQYTSPGSICLLSCASPSYSLWKNFEEKGDEFVKAVKKYYGKKFK